MTVPIDPEVWAEVLGSAPDPDFEPDLKSFLGSRELSGELARALDRTLVSAWRRDGIASDRDTIALWINTGKAALTLGRHAAGDAEFTLACGEIARSLTESDPYAESLRLWTKVGARLILASDEETVHPDLCRSLATDNARYVRHVAAHFACFPCERLHQDAAAALSLTLSALHLLTGPRRAVEGLPQEMADLAEATIDLIDCLRSAMRTALGAILSRLGRTERLPAPPEAWLRWIAASARLQLAEAERGCLADSTEVEDLRRALEHIDAMPDMSAASEIWAAGAVLMRMQCLVLLGRPDDALGMLEAIPASVRGRLRELGATRLEALARFKAGQYECAKQRLLAEAATREAAVSAWRGFWLSPSALPLLDMARGDPLTSMQSVWRLLALTCARLGDHLGVAEWGTLASGCILDSLISRRVEWAERVRRDRGRPSVVRFGWAPTTGATARAVMEELRGLHEEAEAVALPSRVDVPPAPVPPPTACQLRDVLVALGSGATIVLPLLLENRLFTLIARLPRADLELQLLEDGSSAEPILEVLRQWDAVYAGDPGRGSRHWIERAERTFSRLLSTAGRTWTPMLDDLLDEGTTECVFVPDLMLADVPFHVTPVSRRPGVLIDHCPVSYAPSLYALWCCCGRRPIPADRRAGLRLRNLLHRGELRSKAVHEAREIAATLETDVVEVDPRDDDYWESVAGAQILHIVAHGQHRIQHPLQAAIRYGPVQLSLSTLIGGLALPACDTVSNLICESAFPGLARAPALDLTAAMLAAGARTVLASTWVVSDDLASRVTRRYFQHWAEGLPPGRAMWQALAHVRSDGVDMPTFYWAGVRVVGAPG